MSVFEICQPNDDPECWEEIEAYDAETAAALWGEKDDERTAAYYIANGGTVFVLVRIDNGDVQGFNVDA